MATQKILKSSRGKAKELHVGDLFRDGGHKCTIIGDRDWRIMKCLGPTRVEIVTPSDMQINSDAGFRNGDWKDTAISDVDALWYTTRGWKVVE
jgi:hypothetical protein